MVNSRVKEKRLSELREQAEKLLEEKITGVDQVKLEDVREIIHELQVHRIELEIQNEELRRVQAELQESQDKFLNLYNSAPIGYFTLDDSGVIREANNTGAKLLGTEKSKLRGVAFTHFISPDCQDMFYFHCRELFRKAAKQHCVLTLLRKDNTPFFAQIESSVLTDAGGRSPQHQIIVIDITERKQAEEKAREAEALKEIEQLRKELLADISHELRTPLASIKGFSTMLLDYEKRLKADEKRKYLRTIDEATDRLVELISQLLDLSRLDAGKMVIDKKYTNLDKLLRDVIGEARVRSSRHRLKLDLSENLPWLNIDPKRIRQVIDNLIDNAAKYSEADTEIIIAARRNAGDILISITDQGIGIPQQDIPRLFGYMFRSAKSRVLGIPGAGLGLSICKRLVEAHGGSIWIESKEGKGTRCFFTLPVIVVPDGSGSGKTAV
jgi:chemotaxis family two-component system sensor kinase Cph1